jgi:PAS domain S-box-containing protein
LIELSNYAFEPLRENEEYILYSGRRDGELPGILALTPVSEHPTLQSLERLEHEFSLRDELDSAWAARPLALAHHLGRTMLVIEDPGGIPLDVLLDQSLELSRFLRLAAGISAALGRLHQRGLIHEDIKPANILVDSATGAAWLTGFGIASRLPRERQTLPRERQTPEPPEMIAGTLAYMAPEQTGRMNRSIDFRSDLYSLGVALYQMLTGVLPFIAADPMEWVHCHIARQPAPPDKRIRHVPGTVSAIIMKLLAKTAEERYQTAAGLETDLRRCLEEWGSRGCIEPFPLGAHDASDRLLIPEKLYGREREIEALLLAFDRVVASGKSELVLLSGYSGIGKSSVVNELQKALVPLPLLCHGEAFGALTLHAGEPDAFNESAIEQYTDLATNLSYGVIALHTREERTRAENEIRQLNASLEKRVAERTTELVRSEEKFRALFEGTSLAVVLHDENMILEANPSWLRLLGYSDLNEVIGKNPAELSAPIQPGGERAEALVRMHIANTLANGSERFDWIMLRRDGTELPMELFLTRIQLGDRQLIQAVCNDITQRKKAEAELVRTPAREKELGQLRSKFVSMVSHEFRTPLGIIQSSAEILEDYLDRLEPAEREDHLRSIRNNTRRMALIMEEVLLIGSFDAGKMEFKPAPLDLPSFVRKLVDEVLSATGQRCPIELSIPGIPGEIQADERLLRHIFTNLLTNAVKYSDAGRPVQFEIRRGGGETVCVVRDLGIGIPEADREWLFNAFHRGHNVDERPGTGLGLVIVKRCVDLHGGKIDVVSKVGEGTTVTVKLPASSQFFQALDRNTVSRR